ncbi:hypothetical protein CXB51_013813 [Gossypium anomalum]|uniref:Uncharacterized protein n=1 Tax=Gossypium anomalum TaxID=47600 RepID=A0A8J5YZD7_9ROSI|nr:hypothetical protein CXB51_013813 [Gossypium anomalum]
MKPIIRDPAGFPILAIYEFLFCVRCSHSIHMTTIRLNVLTININENIINF